MSNPNAGLPACQHATPKITVDCEWVDWDLASTECHGCRKITTSRAIQTITIAGPITNNKEVSRSPMCIDCYNERVRAWGEGR